MLLRSNLYRFFSVAVLILGLTAFALADTIRLKDGSIVKGKIIGFSGGKFVLVIGQGERQRQMTFFADEVESIEFDNEFNAANPSTPAVDNESRRPSYTKTTNGNETIITVGSSRRSYEGTPIPDAGAASSSNPLPSASEPEPATVEYEEVDDEPILIDNTPASNPVPAKPKPIQINITVLADNTANGWTNAGWVVRKGQKIRIIANGRISLGNGRSSGPQGISTLPDENKLIKDRPTGSLIAVIGDDNNEFIYIGESREFVATRDGALFLGVNEGNLNDNSGSFDTILEIEADGN